MARLGRGQPFKPQVGKIFHLPVNFSQTFNETVTMSDTYSTIKAKGLEFFDTFTITDLGITRVLTRIFSDTTTLSEVFSKAYGRFISFSETVTMSDVISKIYGRFIVFNDTVNLSDNISKTITRIFTEASITLSDTLSKVYGRFISFSETVTLSDTMSKLRGAIFSDTITLSEQFAKFLNGVSVLWTKVGKTTNSTWNKITRTISDISDWNKKERQS